MLYQKHIIIAIAVLVVAGGLWFASAPKDTGIQPVSQTEQNPPTIQEQPTAATTEPQKQQISTKPAEPPRIQLAGKTDFQYDIVTGQTPCGDKIGTVEIVSSDPSKELHWGFTGAKPIWLTFSEVEGKTPVKVDMTFNCILSGAEDAIDWQFTAVEKTKDGKWVDGYARIFTLKGDIR